jgi:hypothetical protein
MVPIDDIVEEGGGGSTDRSEDNSGYGCQPILGSDLPALWVLRAA